MGRRPRSAGRKKPREWKPSDERVIGTEADLAYAKATRRRLAQRKQRKRVIQLAVLAVLGFSVYLWGDDVWYAVRTRAQANAQKFKDSADYLKKSRDERSGANFDENAPDQQTPPAPTDTSGTE
jgi:hypothetical protein